MVQHSSPSPPAPHVLDADSHPEGGPSPSTWNLLASSQGSLQHAHRAAFP